MMVKRLFALSFFSIQMIFYIIIYDFESMKPNHCTAYTAAKHSCSVTVSFRWGWVILFDMYAIETSSPSFDLWINTAPMPYWPALQWMAKNLESWLWETGTEERLIFSVSKATVTLPLKYVCQRRNQESIIWHKLLRLRIHYKKPR